MIAFDLNCGNGHTFEGWFKDNDSFEEQLESGMISCPICDSKVITKALSTFAIMKGKKGDRPESSAPASTAVPENVPSPKALMALNRQIVDFVEKNFDDVGSDFAKEALKIHCGASAPRNIRGVSTSEEEKILKDEGVDFLKLPTIPETDKDFDA